MGANDRLNEQRRSLWVVLLATIAGGLIRVWSPGRLGLVHFDEGIYALAGLWPISGNGFWGIDPTAIAYAPGGYPFLIGLGSFVLGVGDLTPILVSIVMGTLTIPLAAWLSWRTFGPTAGAVAATFAAVSGFHIAFSRTALTDASFLFFFILALGLGQRFLERPNVLRAIGLGVGVGLAQWFKYHGWLAGAIVALSALAGAIVDPAERTSKRLLAVWGQGACAALLAFGVFLPWFRFVESHGGYSELLRHHASYMQGFRPWLSNLQIQLDQAAALDRAAGIGWTASAAAVFFTLVLLSGGRAAVRPRRERFLYIGTGLFAAWLAVAAPAFGWWLGALLPLGLRGRSLKIVFIGVWWIVFSGLTPFYHPYARLWLPLEGCRWIVLGGFGSLAVAEAKSSGPPIALRLERAVRGGGRRLAAWSLAGVFLLIAHGAERYGRAAVPPVGNRSDSLRIACGRIQADLPKGLTQLRFLGRPPITFYLGTAGVPLAPQPDLDALLKPGDPRAWALVDDAMLRQAPDRAQVRARLTKDWEIEREYPTTLNLPTLLDLNPGAAQTGIESSMLECPLLLLRPRSRGIR